MQNTIKGSSFQADTKLDNQCKHKLVGNRMVKYEGDTVCMLFTRWGVCKGKNFFLKFLFSNWEKEAGKNSVIFRKYHEVLLKVSS